MKKVNLKTKSIKLGLNIDRETVTVDKLNANLETWANTENNLVLNFVHGNYDKKFNMLLKPLVTQRKNEEWAKDRQHIIAKHSDGHKFLSCCTNVIKATVKERLEALKHIAETSFTTYAKNVSMRGLSDAINKIKKLKGIKKATSNAKILSSLKTNKSKKVAKKNSKKITANATPILTDVLVKSVYDVINQVKLILPKLKNNKTLTKYVTALEGNLKIAIKK